MLVTDQQRVAETVGRDQPGAPRLALDQGVGDQRGGVNDRGGDLRRAHVGAAEQLGDPLAHPVEGIGRGRQHLLDVDRAGGGVEQHDVGERATDVDGEAQIASHERSSRGGAKTSRIQHSPYSSSPMNTESPCQTLRRGEVDVALVEHGAPLVVGVADAEVEGTAHDDPELLVVRMVVEERAGRPRP